MHLVQLPSRSQVVPVAPSKVLGIERVDNEGLVERRQFDGSIDDSYRVPEVEQAEPRPQRGTVCNPQGRASLKARLARYSPISRRDPNGRRLRSMVSFPRKRRVHSRPLSKSRGGLLAAYGILAHFLEEPARPPDARGGELAGSHFTLDVSRTPSNALTLSVANATTTCSIQRSAQRDLVVLGGATQGRRDSFREYAPGKVEPRGPAPFRFRRVLTVDEERPARGSTATPAA